jgi:hypothetical protein
MKLLKQYVIAIAIQIAGLITAGLILYAFGFRFDITHI